MELHHLRYFVTIAEQRGFSRAAETLGLTQPSLSRQIRDLERELGGPLFNREGRSISLTALGTAFLPSARAALAETARGVHAVQEVLGAQRGTLILGSSPQSAATVLAPLVQRWRTAHPRVQVQIREAGALELVGMLEDGEVDLAVVPVDAPAPLEVFPFLVTRVLAVARHSHPLMSAATVDLKALVAAPGQEPLSLLLLKEQFLTRLRLSAAWEGAGLRPYIAMESAVGQTLAAYAEAGLGVALLPETVDLRGFDLARAVLLDDGVPLVLRNGLGWNGRRSLSSAARAFVDIVRRVTQTRAE